MDETLMEISVCNYVDLICKICNFNFTRDVFIKNSNDVKREELLNGHIFKEHLLEINERVVKCLKCEIQFDTSDVKKHFITDHHQIKSCNKCGCKFNTIKQCYKHIQSCDSINKSENMEKEIYACTLCNKEIEQFEKLVDHFIESHVNEKICIICNKYCFSNIKKHIYFHRPGRLKLICYRCLKCFQTKKELLLHKKTDDHSRKTCDICKETYTGRKEHHEVKHSNYMCHLCGKILSTTANLARHIETVHGGRRFYCDKCECSRSTRFALKQHYAKKHEFIKISEPKRKKSTEYYECPNCPRKIAVNNAKSIERHKIFHESGDKFQCLISGCRHTFLNMGSRLEHMSQDHNKLVCKNCNKEYFNSVTFQSHCFLHKWRTTLNVPEATCRICNNDFTALEDLKKHVRKNYRLFLCAVKGCGEIFTNSNLIGRHNKTGVHGEKHFQFSCDVCKEKFKSKRTLFLHEKQHDTSRTFKCSKCTSLFKTSSQLKRHFRIHTGEKPYECQFCEKRFANDSTLKLHERVHTGEKPYTCPICEKRFADGSYYRKHMSQHKTINNDSS